MGDDHVELDGSLLDRPLGLEHLRRGEVGAVGETDHRADEDVGARKGIDAADDVEWAAAHGGDVVLGGDGTAADHLVNSQLRLDSEWSITLATRCSVRFSTL